MRGARHLAILMLRIVRLPRRYTSNLKRLGTPVRITITHNRSKEEVIQSIDRGFDQVFQEAGSLPVKVVVEQRSWQGSTMNFLLTAKMGIISTPIKGTVDVTEKDLTIDVDLGMFNRFVNEKSAQQMIGSRIKGLLN